MTLDGQSLRYGIRAARYAGVQLGKPARLDDKVELTALLALAHQCGKTAGRSNGPSQPDATAAATKTTPPEERR